MTIGTPNTRTPSCALSIEEIAQWASEYSLDFRHDTLTGMGAVYSLCGRYRYLLWRVWNPSSHMLGFAMLNPSKAGHDIDDPTIARCTRRGQAMPARYDIGGILVWNLFAYRATDPADMRRQIDPKGDANEAAMFTAIRRCAATIAAWGTHGTHNDRASSVLRVLAASDVRLHVLGMTKGGHPRHPLYVAGQVQLELWDYNP